MQRRNFINIAGSAAFGTWAIPQSLFSKNESKTMTAGDLNTYLRSLVEVNEPSVDRIIIGNPETKINIIGTAWMPYWNTLKKAKKQGVNVMVVHEPTFYTHWDLDATNGDYLSAPEKGKDNYLEQVKAKQKWIEQNEMVVIRCHDVLDKISGYGIPFALGRAIGLNKDDMVRSKTYYNVYKIKPTPANEIAQKIARKLKTAGQPGVAFYGDENFNVETIGLGTGCICNPLNFMDLNPDLYIAIDDSINTWTQTTFAEDTGKPLVVINHGTSEEFGVAELSEQLKLNLTNYEVIHFKQGCSYKWIS